MTTFEQKNAEAAQVAEYRRRLGGNYWLIGGLIVAAFLLDAARKRKG